MNAIARWKRSAPLLAVAVAGALVLLRPEPLLARAPSEPELRPYTARYQALRNGKTLGQAVVTLARDGENWRLRSQTRGTEGLASLAGIEIVEDSLFRQIAGKPETIDYRFHQKAAWSNRDRHITVSKAGGILSEDRKDSHRFDYRRGAIDRHLITLALAADLARGAPGPFRYPVVDRDELSEHVYRRGGEETLKSPAGALRTVRLTRVRENPGRVTESWLAIEKGFVPVRVLQTEPDGESFELRLLELRR